MNLEYRKQNFYRSVLSSELRKEKADTVKTIRGTHGDMESSRMTKSLTKERDNRTTNKLKTTI